MLNVLSCMSSLAGGLLARSNVVDRVLEVEMPLQNEKHSRKK